MRILTLLLLLLVTSAQAETVRLDSSREDTVYVARGQDIEIAGQHGNFVISGSAGRVTVDGHHNDVVIEDAAEIVVAGHHLDIRVARTGSILLTGHHNDVVVTACQPSVTYVGDYNQVVSSMGVVENQQGNAPNPLELVLTGAGREETLEADGKAVIIQGSSNRFVLQGRPYSVTVTGALNEVDLQETSEIIVTGAENVVRYKSGQPRVKNTGLNNQVLGP